VLVKSSNNHILDKLHAPSLGGLWKKLRDFYEQKSGRRGDGSTKLC
jgi:hypothetical protein